MKNTQCQCKDSDLYKNMPDKELLKCAKILVIDDEEIVGISYQRILEHRSLKFSFCQDPKEGRKRALSGEYDILLLDVIMPDIDGLDLLKEIKSQNIELEVIIITGYSTIPSAVSAIKLGAFDYLSKPFTPDEILKSIVNTLRKSAILERRSKRVDGTKQSKLYVENFHGLIGISSVMKQMFALIERVAQSEGTILITGESGTGKEMVARAIHNVSPRRDFPFMACDCSALTPTLLASELFGHVKGSFTGAISTKLGLFEVAGNGTLFLDEISNISQEIQSTLLRVLETKNVRKVGDVKERFVDIRLIAATNKCLSEMVREGTFREDLFYRLNVVPINIPPLRERKEDIPYLANTFLTYFKHKNNNLKLKCFSDEVLEKFSEYPWPGNVRELKNTVERITILVDDEVVEVKHIEREINFITNENGKDKDRDKDRDKERERDNDNSDNHIIDPNLNWEEFKNYKHKVQDDTIKELEKNFIIQNLERTNGNVSLAAKMLGIQRTNLHAIIKKYNIHVRSNSLNNSGEELIG
ncbi:MAG: sigma-54-dependent Fis family transcriptional regulator [Oligoflexia bacterium]|nr:sigma-54-dependent Fis family transcriptional regulator [Oligoflexia bacterium]